MNNRKGSAILGVFMLIIILISFSMVINSIVKKHKLEQKKEIVVEEPYSNEDFIKDCDVCKDNGLRCESLFDPNTFTRKGCMCMENRDE